jgi:hypothetical protein
MHVMSVAAVEIARHLKALRWGSLEGPLSYAVLPPELRSAAAAADRIGDDLARLRVALFPEGEDIESLVVQVQLVAHALAFCVVAEAAPDPSVVWTRRDLEGAGFDPAALDAAIHFLALGGEPNVFRSEGDAGWPALRDVRAFQHVAGTLVDLCDGVGDFEPISPTLCIEDFARMHWGREGEEGALGEGWEEHPLGMACFQAVRLSRHIPAEPARAPETPMHPSRSEGGEHPFSGPSLF